MKYIKLILATLLLMSTACTQKTDEPTTQANPAQKTPEDVIKTEAISIDSAQKTLQESKKVEQTIMDSASEQRENIEKTEQ